LCKLLVYKDENKTKKQKRYLKTENMKTTVKQLAAGTFIALLLLVGNGYAKGTEAKASSHESIETTLQIEKWMINEVLWNTNAISIAKFIQETESSLELENWMTNSENWNLNTSFAEVSEESMELENWMTSEETWNVNDMNNETELTVENWMINNNVWNN